MDQQCLLVQELNPFNLSREESQTVSLIDQLLMIDCSPGDLETVFFSFQVSLTVPGLPLLDESESYTCIFEDIPSHAVVSGSRVSCQSPSPGSLPMVPLGQGEQLLDSLSVHIQKCAYSISSRNISIVSILSSSDSITVTLSLRFGGVIIAARDFTFYDCTAVKQLSGRSP